MPIGSPFPEHFRCDLLTKTTTCVLLLQMRDLTWNPARNEALTGCSGLQLAAMAATASGATLSSNPATGVDSKDRISLGAICHALVHQQPVYPRVRRALDLQTSAGQSAQGRTTSTASTQLRMRPAPPTAAANPAVRPALAPAAHGEQHSSSSLMGSPGNLLQAWAWGGQLLPALARKRLVPMEEEEDEQGLRRMRSRDRSWAAAAEGMAELRISGGSMV